MYSIFSCIYCGAPASVSPCVSTFLKFYFILQSAFFKLTKNTQFRTLFHIRAIQYCWASGIRPTVMDTAGMITINYRGKLSASCINLFDRTPIHRKLFWRFFESHYDFTLFYSELQLVQSIATHLMFASTGATCYRFKTSAFVCKSHFPGNLPFSLFPRTRS